MHRLRIIGGAGALVAAALVGGTLISATLAADDGDPTSGTTAVMVAGPLGGEYAETYLDTLAAELSVERAELGPAAIAAATAAIDAAVEAGDLDAERAADLKERLAELDDPARLLVGPGLHRHAGPGIGPGMAIGIGNVLEAAADALGVDVDDVIAAFRDGTGLEEQAEANGVDYATVTAAVLDAARAELDDEVADEDLSRERADEILDRLEGWLEDGGERPARPVRARGALGFGL